MSGMNREINGSRSNGPLVTMLAASGLLVVVALVSAVFGQERNGVWPRTVPPRPPAKSTDVVPSKLPPVTHISMRSSDQSEVNFRAPESSHNYHSQPIPNPH